MATIILTDEDNGIINNEFQYLLGFQPSLGGIVINKDSVNIFLDSRYFVKTQSVERSDIIQKSGKEKVHFIQVHGSLIDAMLLHSEESKTLLLEDNITLKYFQEINDKSNLGISKNPKKTEAIRPYFELHRVHKNESEIKNIKKAIEIIDNIYLYIESLNEVGKIAGKTERELRTLIVNEILEQGGEKESFEAIVAFGKHSAIPHHTATDTLIGNGPLLIDMGALYHGYCSDFTRTFWVGETSPQPSPLRGEGAIYDYKEFKNIYNSVAKAHKAALSVAKVGVNAVDIDKAARESIIADGYGEFFTHSTGHGVGLNVHEKPWITPNSKDIIEPGMVFTIEPGIYFPGKFGVRIENIVIAGEKKVESMSKVGF